MTESVKTILGDELAAQVETALKGRGKDGKDLELVVGNDGTFVPAEKFEQLKGQSASAEKALKAAADALKAVGGSGDPAKIADDVRAAQATIDGLRADHQREIAQLRKNTAVRMALDGKVHDPADILALLNLDEIEVDDAGNLQTDLDGLLQPIRETKAYLFREEKKETQDIRGAKPADPGLAPKQDAQGGPVIF